jgi:protein FAM32A
MDLYKTAVKGGLKLKGSSSSSSSSGADTKKYALQKSMTGKSLANNTPLYRKKTKRKQEDITASSSATPPSVNHERESKDSGEKKTVVNQTAAERAFEEKQKKRKLEQIEKFAKQSHKDRVNEFNKKLERLSEHHDIPKVR